MVFRPVTDKQVIGRRRQLGMTLVELMVASLLGLLALSVAGQVVVRGQRYVAQRSMLITLQQNMHSVLQVMKDDVYQAGFDPQGEAVTLAGSVEVVQLQSAPAALGYVYRAGQNGDQAYRNVVYRFESAEGLLRLCEKASAVPLSLSQAARSGSGGNCYSLFDPKQITVRSFRLESLTVAGPGGRSQLIRVGLSAALTRAAEHSYTLSFELIHRNGR